MTRPFISVIVPAYNEENYLDACLTSLTRQAFPSADYEVIVVDNASTDRTAEIAKKYPVKVVSEPRRSVVRARQAGFDASRGQIIASADADTVYPSGWLRLISAAFHRRPQITAVVGWIYYTGTPAWFNFFSSFNQQLNLISLRIFNKFPLVYAANFSFRRSALAAIGGYPTHLPELGDQQYLLFKMQKLGPVIINPRIYCHTSSRRHQGHISHLIFYNGWYRLLGFVLNNFLKKPVIGPAPAVRTIPARRSRF